MEASQETKSNSESRRGASLSSRSGNGAPLESDRGQTSIDDAVVTKVAGIAAREVRGDERTQGVSVEVGEREAAVDLTAVIEYGESIPQVAEQIRDNVVKRVEGITGLSVTEVNVSVNDLHFPGDDRPPAEEPRVS